RGGAWPPGGGGPPWRARGVGAKIGGGRWGERGRTRHCRSSSAGHPISTGSRGSAPLHRKATARRSRYTCANLTRGHKTARDCLADEGHHGSPIHPAAEAGGSDPSRRLRLGGAACGLVSSRMERERIRALAVGSKCAGAPRHGGREPRRIHPVTARFGRG